MTNYTDHKQMLHPRLKIPLAYDSNICSPALRVLIIVFCTRHLHLYFMVFTRFVKKRVIIDRTRPLRETLQSDSKITLKLMIQNLATFFGEYFLCIFMIIRIIQRYILL